MSESTPTGDIGELVRRLNWFYDVRANGSPEYRQKYDESMPDGENGRAYHLVGVLQHAASALTHLSSALTQIIAYAEECEIKAHEDVSASFNSNYRYYNKEGAIAKAKANGAEACAKIARAALGKEQVT